MHPVEMSLEPLLNAAFILCRKAMDGLTWKVDFFPMRCTSASVSSNSVFRCPSVYSRILTMANVGQVLL